MSFEPLPHRSLPICSGKYDKDNLPEGPRASLFRQILPGAQPLLETLQEIAKSRRKTVPQVVPCVCKLRCGLLHSLSGRCQSVFLINVYLMAHAHVSARLRESN